MQSYKKQNATAARKSFIITTIFVFVVAADVAHGQFHPPFPPLYEKLLEGLCNDAFLFILFFF